MHKKDEHLCVCDEPTTQKTIQEREFVCTSTRRRHTSPLKLPPAIKDDCTGGMPQHTFRRRLLPPRSSPLDRFATTAPPPVVAATPSPKKSRTAGDTDTPVPDLDPFDTGLFLNRAPPRSTANGSDIAEVDREISTTERRPATAFFALDVLSSNRDLGTEKSVEKWQKLIFLRKKATSFSHVFGLLVCGCGGVGNELLD